MVRRGAADGRRLCSAGLVAFRRGTRVGSHLRHSRGVVPVCAVARNAGCVRRGHGPIGRAPDPGVRADAIEALSKVDHVVVDKTGTLTTGARRTQRRHRRRPARPFSMCRHCARARRRFRPSDRACSCGDLVFDGRTCSPPLATNIVATSGCGVEGSIAGRVYRFGRPDWVAALRSHQGVRRIDDMPCDQIRVTLGDSDGLLGLFAFGDRVRPDAAALIAWFHQRHIAVSLVSGDRTATVAMSLKPSGYMTSSAMPCPPPNATSSSRCSNAAKWWR